MSKHVPCNESMCLFETYTKEETDNLLRNKLESGDFAVLTGTVSGTGTKTVETLIAYPTGFNISNCVIISHSICNVHNQTNGYSSGTTLDNISYVFGGVPNVVCLLSSGIKLRIKNINIDDDGITSVLDIPSTTSFSYKIVLKKVS